MQEPYKYRALLQKRPDNMGNLCIVALQSPCQQKHWKAVTVKIDWYTWLLKETKFDILFSKNKLLL